MRLHVQAHFHKLSNKHAKINRYKNERLSARLSFNRDYYTCMFTFKHGDLLYKDEKRHTVENVHIYWCMALLTRDVILDRHKYLSVTWLAGPHPNIG